MPALHKIVFLLESQYREASLSDAAQAREEYRKLGLETQIEYVEQGMEPELITDIAGDAREETLCLADSERILRAVLASGTAAAGYLHSANRAEKLRGVDYLLEEPQWLSLDSMQKVWQRQRHLPWTVLETSRCVVREFTAADLDAVYGLYDEKARRFLEPPSDDREREAEILQAYIDRIYRLYGYGQWAVLSRSDGRLIGRMGYSFPAGPETALGADVSLGFLLSREYRRRGIAEEVCRALVRYGFEELGFDSISAEAAKENPASNVLLRRLGFKRVELPADPGDPDSPEEFRTGDEADDENNYYIIYGGNCNDQ